MTLTLTSTLPKVLSLGTLFRCFFQAHVKVAFKPPHYAASGYRIKSLCCGDYSEPAAPSAFCSLPKLREAVRHATSKQTKTKRKTSGQINAWLETQHAYTRHRPVRKRFPRNPYTVNNIDDVWETDILDLSSLKKFDNPRHLLQVIDVFLNYLHSIPLRTKTGKEIASALESILQDPKYTKPIRRRLLWVCTNKGKEFLNTQFQTFLKREGIEFQV
jgi:hypothetical protein